jgi:hypothetical protein
MFASEEYGISFDWFLRPGDEEPAAPWRRDHPATWRNSQKVDWLSKAEANQGGPLEPVKIGHGADLRQHDTTGFQMAFISRMKRLF